MRQERLPGRAERACVRKLAPLDDLDELIWAPPPLPLNRYCGADGCRRRVRPGGRHCPACHAAAARRSREKHVRELAVRRRDVAAQRDADARLRDSARAKVAMALKRGSLERGHCGFCGSAGVIALIADPARWREIVWVCRQHRQAELDRRAEAQQSRASEARQAAWFAERERVLAAIDLLPSEDQALLHALAARGPLGTQLAPEAPLYAMNLVRVFKAQFSGVGLE